MADSREIAGYTVLRALGEGARSTIYAVKDADGNLFALKRVTRTSSDDQRFIDQALVEHEIANRFCDVRLRKSFKVIRQRSFIRVSELLVLMEMVDGTTLERYQPSGMLELCHICLEVARGLKVMHEAGIVHADIKPINILVTEMGRVKIIDFGQSCPTGTVKERIQGTPDYIAPEQVRREAITPATDIFNLGATMYWLLTGRHVPTLFPKGAPGQLSLTSSEKLTPPVELNAQVPSALSQLVMECVMRQPHDRPGSMREVIDRLEIARDQIKRREKGNGQGAAG